MTQLDFVPLGARPWWKTSVFRMPAMTARLDDDDDDLWLRMTWSFPVAFQ
jgi:hypothetical protein